METPLMRIFIQVILPIFSYVVQVLIRLTMKSLYRTALDQTPYRFQLGLHRPIVPHNPS